MIKVVVLLLLLFVSGCLTAKDVSLYVVGLKTLTPQELKQADVSKNNRITSYDAALILGWR